MSDVDYYIDSSQIKERTNLTRGELLKEDVSLRKEVVYLKNELLRLEYARSIKPMRLSCNDC